ncbi:MAG: hypothetical protein ACRDPY_29910 [Streptosporangiaceae bacterium]
MRWLSAARGLPQAADALVKLGWCAPAAWQAATGLQRIEQLTSTASTPQSRAAATT